MPPPTCQRVPGSIDRPSSAFVVALRQALQEPDHDAVNTLVLRGRGGQCLQLLAKDDGDKEDGVWWCTDLVDMLISLFQVGRLGHIRPSSLNRHSYPFQLLSATNEDPRRPSGSAEVPGRVEFKPVVSLLEQVSALYGSHKKKKTSPGKLSKGKKHHRQLRRSEGGSSSRLTQLASASSAVPSSPLRGFPSPPSCRSTASNLHMYEPPSEAATPTETDSDVTFDERGRRPGGHGNEEGQVKPFPRNPMDFEYFEKVSRGSAYFYVTIFKADPSVFFYSSQCAVKTRQDIR